MNRVIFGLIIFLFLSCGHSKKGLVAVEFKDIRNSNEYGIPHDSSVVYFPVELFRDTDTFKIETKHTTFLEVNSYMYYKMNEPVLFSRYLKKDVYRLTYIRTNSNPPFVVTIEKYKDSVVLISKELNRRISYPFIKHAGPVIYIAPINRTRFNKKEENQRLAEIKRKNDSIGHVYNNYNYYLVLYNRMRISRDVWDSLEVMVDSAKFWKSKPLLDLSYVEGDDSKWIFEGHSENGYQIRIVPSIHVSSEINGNKSDTKKNDS